MQWSSETSGSGRRRTGFAGPASPDTTRTGSSTVTVPRVAAAAGVADGGRWLRRGPPLATPQKARSHGAGGRPVADDGSVRARARPRARRPRGRRGRAAARGRGRRSRRLLHVADEHGRPERRGSRGCARVRAQGTLLRRDRASVEPRWGIYLAAGRRTVRDRGLVLRADAEGSPRRARRAQDDVPRRAPAAGGLLP